jgi:hypothetical protein
MSALRTFLGLSIAVAIGCGGSTSSETSLDGGHSPDGTGGGSSSGGDDNGGDSAAPGDDSGLPVVGPDGGLVVPPEDDDASTTVDSDAATGPGGGVTTPLKGTDGGADQIACGMKPCDSATQVCCVAKQACTTAAECMGSKLACSGTNSCATGVCCEEAAGNTASSKCEATCPKGAVQLCTTNADCTTAGDICRRVGAEFAICAKAPTPLPARDAGVVIMRGKDGG